MYKSNTLIFHLMLISGLIISSTNAMAFNSGSTESDGTFSPTADIDIQLPEDGILNYTDIIIPANVHVTFSKNTTNTPVTLLASGDVTIDGVLDVSGAPSGAVGSAGDGNSADDGKPGEGGPGGYAGGAGGVFDSIGGTGLGSGGGAPGPERCVFTTNNSFGAGGAGGGYSITGFNVPQSTTCLAGGHLSAQGGPAYGSPSLTPILGGSGGGGGHGGLAFPGSGGGGGGGAVLIAASGTVTINGSITADGGPSGTVNAANSGGSGGGGSGGAIRIVATTIAGNGGIFARGGAAGTVVQHNGANGSNGAPGFIRLEAETLTRSAGSNPAMTFTSPQSLFIAGLPGLHIASVAGINAPASPTGKADIVIPESTPNPVLITFESNGVPLGTTISLIITPSQGNRTTVISSAISGTEENGTADASVNIPDGASVLSAQVSYTVTAALGEDLSRFAQGKPVRQVIITSSLKSGSMTTLVTASGEQFSWPSNTIKVF